MKRATTIISIIACAFVLSASAADEQDNRSQRRGVGGDIDRRIQSINRLDNNDAARRAGIAAVSKETAVPLPTIEAEARDHSTVGLGGLFMAHELSVKTKKSVDQLIKQRQTGKTWAAIARENDQNLNEIDQKLARIESAMQSPGAAGGVRAANQRNDRNDRDDRSAVRERETPRTELDRRIDSLNTLDDQPGVMRTGLAALSRETATPLPRIEELQKQHTTAGVGDLFVAQELATRTQKAPDEFLRQHSSGKSWAQIISENNQDRSQIEQKVARIEQAMKDAPR